ncbi:uncharacterized protein LOC117521545 [Thalassophryne amazonica]|uniref:uncharacterized protein LOC117521545 n=1 Tax=Thalassophryne amazonica TaxID=390379 RepID=UPI001471A00C|nr:uncharacterized protein LOC117521545 [Thalassophryne amazonica]
MATSGSPGIGSVGCWVILLLVGGAMVSSCWGMTEGNELNKIVRFKTGWKESSRNRTQDNFTCKANHPCRMINLTSNCDLWSCVTCVANHRVPIFTKGCNVTLSAEVNICVFNMTSRICTTINGTTWTVKLQSQIFISNGTTIEGRRTRFLYGLRVLPKEAKATQTQVAPLIDTCTHLAQATVKTKVYWQITFPNILTCRRRRRAWYDTLLGGTGTVLGVSNTVDNEVTRTMLSNTGQYSSQVLHQIGEWLPTALVGQLQNADLWQKSFQWQMKLWNETYDSLKNLSHISNWTACAMQTIHAEALKERFQRIVTAGNYYDWRRIWNITDTLWLKLHPEFTQCNETVCTGHWTQYNVTQPKVVCKYQVLPVITTNGYWFLHMDGEWLEPKTNTTFDTKMCDITDKGMTCVLQTGYANPCLTDSEVVLCDWTRETPREMWQIGPHTLCVATMTENSQVPSVPYTGCLNNVHLWHWGNRTYRLTNYSVSFD